MRLPSDLFGLMQPCKATRQIPRRAGRASTVLAPAAPSPHFHNLVFCIRCYSFLITPRSKNRNRSSQTEITCSVHLKQCFGRKSPDLSILLVRLSLPKGAVIKASFTAYLLFTSPTLLIPSLCCLYSLGPLA